MKVQEDFIVKVDSKMAIKQIKEIEQAIRKLEASIESLKVIEIYVYVEKKVKKKWWDRIFKKIK